LVAGFCCGTGDEVSIYRQIIMTPVLATAQRERMKTDFKIKMLQLFDHSMS